MLGRAELYDIIMKKRFSSVLILISLVLSLLASCVTEPEKTGSTTEEDTPKTQDTQDVTETSEKIDLACLKAVVASRSSLLVKDHIDLSFTSSFTGSSDIKKNSVSFPETLLVGAGAEEFNNKLISLCEERYGSLLTYNSGHMSNAEYSLDVRYEYSYFGGVLTLALFDERTYSDGSRRISCDVLMYDTVTSSEIAVNDLLAICGTNKNELFANALISGLPEGDIIGASMLPDGSFKVYCGTVNEYSGSFYSRPLDILSACEVSERGIAMCGSTLFDTFYGLNKDTLLTSRFSLISPPYNTSGAEKVASDVLNWFYDTYGERISSLTEDYYNELSSDDILYDLSVGELNINGLIGYRITDGSVRCSGEADRTDKVFYYDPEADIGIKEPLNALDMIYVLDPNELSFELFRYYSSAVAETQDRCDIDTVLAFKGSDGIPFGVRLSYTYFNSSSPCNDGYNRFVYLGIVRLLEKIKDSTAAGKEAASAITSDRILYTLSSSASSIDEKKGFFSADLVITDAFALTDEADAFYFDLQRNAASNVNDYLLAFGTDLDKLKKEISSVSGEIVYVDVNSFNNIVTVKGIVDNKYRLIARIDKGMKGDEALEKHRDSLDNSTVFTCFEKEFFIETKEGVLLNNFFRVPALRSTSRNASAFNKKIYNDFESLFSTFIKEYGDKVKTAETARYFTYDYICEEGFAVIKCRYSTSVSVDASRSKEIVIYYYYDIISDREITEKEYNEKAKFSSERDITSFEKITEIIGTAIPAESGIVRTMFEFTVNAPLLATTADDNMISSRVMVPFINSDRPGAKKLNKKILSDFIEKYDSVISESLVAERDGIPSGNTVYDLSYVYSVEGAYIAIELISFIASLPDSYSVEKTYYYYDFENDTIFTKLPDDTDDYLRLPLYELKTDRIVNIAESMMSGERIVLPVNGKKYKVMDGDKLIRAELTVPCINSSLKGSNAMNMLIVADLLTAFDGFIGFKDMVDILEDINTLDEPYEPFGYIGSNLDERNGIMTLDYVKPGETLSDRIYVTRYFNINTGEILSEEQYLALLGENKNSVISEIGAIKDLKPILGDIGAEDILKFSSEKNGDLSVFVFASDRVLKVTLERLSDIDKELRSLRNESDPLVGYTEEKVYIHLTTDASGDNTEDSILTYVYYRMPRLNIDSEEAMEINKHIRELFQWKYLPFLNTLREGDVSPMEMVTTMDHGYIVVNNVLILNVVSETVRSYATIRSGEYLCYDLTADRYIASSSIGERFGNEDIKDVPSLLEYVFGRSPGDLYDAVMMYADSLGTKEGELHLDRILEISSPANGKTLGSFISLKALDDYEGAIRQMNRSLTADLIGEYHELIKNIALSDGGAEKIAFMTTSYSINKECLTLRMDHTLYGDTAEKKEAFVYYYDTERKLRISKDDAYVLMNSFVPDIPGMISSSVTGKGDLVVSAYELSFTVDCGNGRELESTFRLPAINLLSDNARIFNEKLLSLLFDEKLDHINRYSLLLKGDEETVFCSVHYEYIISGNVLVLLVTEDRYTADTALRPRQRVFYYDLANDRELTLSEYLSVSPVSAETILRELNSGRCADLTSVEYGGLYKFKLEDLDGAVVFSDREYDVYLSTPSKLYTIKISYPFADGNEWYAFTVYPYVHRNYADGIRFTHKEWNANKQSSVFVDELEREAYSFYYLDGDTVCIQHKNRGRAGFLIYELSESRVAYSSDIELEELMEAHGIPSDYEIKADYVYITVDSFEPYMLLCSYRYGITVNNGGKTQSAELRGKLAASVYSGRSRLYPEPEKIRLSEIDHSASMIDGVRDEEALRSIAKWVSERQGLGEVSENGFSDEMSEVLELVMNGAVYKLSSTQTSEGILERTVTLTVTEDIPLLMPHGIKMGDSLDDALEKYGYGVRASDISSLIYLDGTFLDDEHTLVTYDEEGYYLIWEYITEDTCHSLTLAFMESDGEEIAYPLSYIEYVSVFLTEETL